MANRAYLVSADKTGRYKELHANDVVCAGNYVVPVFWYMLFEESDAQEFRTPCDDGGDYIYRGYAKERNAAAELAASRVPRLRELFKTDLGSIFNTWHAFVKEQHGELIILEPCELTWMDKKPTKHANESVKCINAFASPVTELRGLFKKKRRIHRNWEMLLVQANIPNVDEQPEIDSLCGFSWEKKVPWEDAQQ